MARKFRITLSILIAVVLNACSTSPVVNDASREPNSAGTTEKYCRQEFFSQIESGSIKYYLDKEVINGLLIFYANRCTTSGGCISGQMLGRKLETEDIVADVKRTGGDTWYTSMNPGVRRDIRGGFAVMFYSSLVGASAAMSAGGMNQNFDKISSTFLIGHLVISVAGSAASASANFQDNRNYNNKLQAREEVVEIFTRQNTKLKLSRASSELRNIFGFSFADQKRLENAVWNDITSPSIYAKVTSEGSKTINLIDYLGKLKIINYSVAREASALVNEFVEMSAKNVKVDVELSTKEKVVLLYKLRSLFRKMYAQKGYSESNRQYLEIAIEHIDQILGRVEMLYGKWKKDC